MHVFQSDLEEQYQKLTIDNDRDEAELKHARQKVEIYYCGYILSYQ